MADPRDILDLSLSVAASPEHRARPGGPDPSGAAKTWLGLWFACANQYGRAYRVPDGTAYLGRCPRCGRSVRFPIGPGGTGERMFRVSCR